MQLTTEGDGSGCSTCTNTHDTVKNALVWVYRKVISTSICYDFPLIAIFLVGEGKAN